jgi:ADP-dependent NAD(P)H-hydrate dehydratase / NAD(P)H-hydrate epimerase
MTRNLIFHMHTKDVSMYLVTAEEMQTMDRRTIQEMAIPGRVLMENAARGAVDIFLNIFPESLKSRIGVMAGRGNNGGDGFVMARCLAQMGAKVTVFLLSGEEKLQEDASANFSLLIPCGVKVVVLPDSVTFGEAKSLMRHQDVWIDAILGTGLKSEVRGYFKEAIDFLNETGKPIFAVDLPSGLNADTGQPLGTCIRATASATFAFAKAGHVLFPGVDLSGRVHIVDIGIPKAISDHPVPGQHLITHDLAQSLVKRRASDDHKGRAGHLVIAAGSPGKTGAAAMCATAAMRAGAGLVTLAVPRGIQPILMEKTTEVMTVDLPETEDGVLSEHSAEPLFDLLKDGKRCLALGPGIGTAPDTGALVHRLMAESTVPLVIDADGLNLLAQSVGVLASAQSPVVLTPHPGEMARLTGLSVPSIQADRLGCARAFAVKWNVHLVLKGAATVVAGPDGTLAINSTGNPGMASGGMGDVLTGIISGLIVQGYDPFSACRLGVFIHGAAADLSARAIGQVGYLAGDVSDRIPGVLDGLLKSKTTAPTRPMSAFITPVPGQGEPFTPQ